MCTSHARALIPAPKQPKQEAGREIWPTSALRCCFHQVLPSLFEMGGETTDEEGDGWNTCKQPPARKKRYTSYNPDWAKLSDFEWVRPTQGDHFSATCVLCPAKISVKYEGKNALEIHAKTKKHLVVLSNKQKQAAIATFMTRKGSPEEDRNNLCHNKQVSKEIRSPSTVNLVYFHIQSCLICIFSMCIQCRRWQQQAKESIQNQCNRLKNICVRETTCVTTKR